MDDEDEYPPDVIRSPEEVTERALALFAAVGCALGAPPKEIGDWLTENDFWPFLTERETRYLRAEQPDRRDKVDFGWQTERLISSSLGAEQDRDTAARDGAMRSVDFSGHPAALCGD